MLTKPKIKHAKYKTAPKSSLCGAHLVNPSREADFVWRRVTCDECLKLKRPDGIETRFWLKVDKATLTGCWEWIGGLNETGHPRFWVNRKLVGAHRLSYELHHGLIAPGLVVMHLCDNPKCVRPEHLTVGTPKDNSEDASRKGRLGKPGCRPISPEVQAEIVALKRAGFTRKWISDHLNVSPRTVKKYAEAA